MKLAPNVPESSGAILGAPTVREGLAASPLLQASPPSSDSGHHPHAGPKLYLIILGALLVLTAVTVAAAGVDFGSSSTNLVIAMIIASAKASLVALYFMHLRWDKPLNATIFVAGLCFLGIMLTFTFMDNTTRVEVHTRTAFTPAIVPAEEGTPVDGAVEEELVSAVPADESATIH